MQMAPNFAFLLRFLVLRSRDLGFVAVSDTAYQAPPYHVIAYDTFQDPCNAYLEAEASRPAFLHCLSMRNVDSSHIRHVPACLITQSQYVIL